MKQKAFMLVFWQLCFTSMLVQAFAAEVTLAWDPPESDSVAGFKLYSGTQPRIYGKPIDMGRVLTYTVSGLTSRTHYFAITAYDGRGNESAHSNEVSVAVAPRPVISGMSVSIITSNSATINWKTDVPSDSQVEHGLTNRYGSSTPLDTRMVTSHTWKLTGLAASTPYHYRVKSKTAAGSLATSENATFTTVRDDSDLPAITIVASNTSASEENLNSGAFTVTRTGSTASSLMVYYTVGGTSSPGSDYNALSGGFNIPAGSSSATIVITPVDDSLVENDETVVITLTPQTAYTVGSPGSATVTIADNDIPAKPVVTVVAADNTATEAGRTTGTFRISRTGSTAASLTVYYGAGGTSSGSSDYNGLSGSSIIPAGSSSATIVITPVDDSLIEDDETVVITLIPQTAYTVDSPGSATVTIADNDTPTKPVVTVVAADNTATEADRTTGTFKISRTGSTAASLKVFFGIGGTSSPGSDFNAFSGVLIFPAGSSSATIVITPTDDSLVEGDETVVITLTPKTAYTVGSPGSATVTIVDNDTP